MMHLSRSPKLRRSGVQIIFLLRDVLDSFIMKFASGGLSGIVSRTVCAPFSRLSVLQETRVSVQSSSNIIVAEGNSLNQTLRSVYKKDGNYLCFI